MQLNSSKPVTKEALLEHLRSNKPKLPKKLLFGYFLFFIITMYFYFSMNYALLLLIFAFIINGQVGIIFGKWFETSNKNNDLIRDLENGKIKVISETPSAPSEE